MVKRVQGQDDRLRTQEKTLKSYKAQLLAATNKTNAPSYLQADGALRETQEYYTNYQYMDIFNKKVAADTLNSQILQQIAVMKQTINEFQ